jgi:DNA-directed RNA polymerase alpha subunit
MTSACDLYLTDMNLPARVKKPLKKAGYETLGDVVSASEYKLRHINGLGEKGLRQLRFAAHAHGYDVLQNSL